MKEDNISQLGDYNVPFCEQEYTHGSCYISLFKFKSFDQLIHAWVLLYLFVQIQIIRSPPPPQTASNFIHVLSCGTIAYLVMAWVWNQ